MRFFILGFALLAACASIGTANVDPAYRPGVNGLLITSVTASGYNPGTLWFQVVRTGAPTQAVASIPVNDDAFGIDWRQGDPAVRNAGYGRLAVIELPPGDYELRRWVINVSNRASYSSIRPLGYVFSIASGKATYLGGVHVDIQRSASTTQPFASFLDDRRERDLPILHARYPSLRPADVAFNDAAVSGASEQAAPRRGATRMDDLQGLLPGR